MRQNTNSSALRVAVRFAALRFSIVTPLYCFRSKYLYFVAFVFCHICILSYCVLSLLCSVFLCFVIFVNCLFVFCRIGILSFCILSYLHFVVLHFVIFVFCLFVFCHFCILSFCILSFPELCFDRVVKRHGTYKLIYS